MDEPIERPEFEPPVFEMSRATVSALRRRGGNLYIWWDNGQAALLRAAAKPPRHAIEYETFSSAGGSVHLDCAIAPTGHWLITWKRLPWPHFKASYDPTDPDTDGGNGITGDIDIIGRVIEAIIGGRF